MLALRCQSSRSERNAQQMLLGFSPGQGWGQTQLRGWGQAQLRGWVGIRVVCGVSVQAVFTLPDHLLQMKELQGKALMSMQCTHLCRDMSAVTTTLDLTQSMLASLSSMHCTYMYKHISWDPCPRVEQVHACFTSGAPQQQESCISCRAGQQVNPLPGRLQRWAGQATA